MANNFGNNTSSSSGQVPNGQVPSQENVIPVGASSTSTQNTRNDSDPSMNNLKYEIANELGVDIKKGGSLTSYEAGKVGGNMVRRMTQEYKKTHKQ